jgi:hypothetical protein
MDKFKSKLTDYIYTEECNIINIPLGSYIKYISKKLLILKSGFLKNIKDSSILELFNTYNRKWFIYTNEYYIFYKIPINNKFKSSLLDLVNSNFQIKKIT